MKDQVVSLDINYYINFCHIFFYMQLNLDAVKEKYAVTVGLCTIIFYDQSLR